MNKLRKLEISKLLKELDYIESDLNLKLETIKEVDENFNNEVENFIDDNPKLKSVWQFQKSSDDPISPDDEDTNVSTEKRDQSLDETDDLYEKKDPKLKNLYRDIAKITHPDKSGDLYLKDIFINARRAYDNGDILSIILICDKLNIPYELSDEEIIVLEERLRVLKERLKFLESTYTYQWFKKPEKKNEIFLSFIKSQLVK